MKFIDVPTFIISFSIGLFFVYISSPKKQTIFVYPTPDNYDKVLFKDKAGMCFSFKPIETTKPANSNLLGIFPLQTSNKILS